jgi:hypothetical protein
MTFRDLYLRVVRGRAAMTFRDLYLRVVRGRAAVTGDVRDLYVRQFVVVPW